MEIGAPEKTIEVIPTVIPTEEPAEKPVEQPVLPEKVNDSFAKIAETVALSPREPWLWKF